VPWPARSLNIAISRANKARNRNLPASLRLICDRGCRALSRLIFALEWRWVPVDHWLEPELATLTESAGTGDLLIDALVTGETAPLETALAILASALRDEGVPERWELYYELCHPDHAARRRSTRIVDGARATVGGVGPYVRGTRQQAFTPSARRPWKGMTDALAHLALHDPAYLELVGRCLNEPDLPRQVELHRELVEHTFRPLGCPWAAGETAIRMAGGELTNDARYEEAFRYWNELLLPLGPC
jgi:hypothetical protein